MEGRDNEEGLGRGARCGNGILMTFCLDIWRVRTTEIDVEGVDNFDGHGEYEDGSRSTSTSTSVPTPPPTMPVPRSSHYQLLRQSEYLYLTAWFRSRRQHHCTSRHDLPVLGTTSPGARNAWAQVSTYTHACIWYTGDIAVGGGNGHGQTTVYEIRDGSTGI